MPDLVYIENEIIYKVSAHDASSDISLVDRGANGGISGSDVRIIEKLHRHVDVQGIDNHRMNDIPIVTAGGVTKTQRGDIILILNQYAYVGKGTSIHSSPQIEAYKNKCDDRAIKVGGKQVIETIDGYSIPLNIKNALPRMKLRPYTDKEWETLPHVFLKSEEDWDSSKLDLEVDSDDNWYDAIADDNDYTINQKFDEFGNYRDRVEVQEATSTYSIHDVVDNCVIYHTNKHLLENIHSNITDLNSVQHRC